MTLRRILRWVIGLPVVVLVVAFAIANRRWVTLSLDPFSQEAPKLAMDMPLWLLYFFGVLVGMFLGWIAAWLAHAKHRRAARELRAEAARMQAELAELRRQRPEGTRQDVAPFEGGFL